VFSRKGCIFRDRQTGIKKYKIGLWKPWSFSTAMYSYVGLIKIMYLFASIHFYCMAIICKFNISYNKILHTGLQKGLIYLAPKCTAYKLLKYFTTHHQEKKYVSNCVLSIFITSYKKSINIF
jgi:hypothetical protein